MQLYIPTGNFASRDFKFIQSYLNERGIACEHYPVPDIKGTNDELLSTLDPFLRPIMEKNGYVVADIVVVTPDTPNLQQIRDKFKAEHTHTEDEVRYFVSGKGYFWFHVAEPVFCVECESGDFISVPAGSRHWFELGEPPSVTVVRLFVDPSGWVPHYTEANVAQYYRSHPTPAHV
jgi:1,2-dihydroxy-3-keto-5-methylthiopentene dioxygenase